MTPRVHSRHPYRFLRPNDQEGRAFALATPAATRAAGEQHYKRRLGIGTEIPPGRVTEFFKKIFAIFICKTIDILA